MIARGWLGTDLNGLRKDSGTYGLYPMESLPPLEDGELDGSLSWLVPLDAELDRSQAMYRPDDESRKGDARRLAKLAKEAAAREIALPELFTRVMGSRELQDQFPSSTACYFSLPEGIAEAPAPQLGHLIRFLNDQQGCLFWYLSLRPDGTQAVVVSPALLDPGEPRDGEPEIFQCADSFEEFLYRYWLENTLWFSLTGEATLDDPQARYAQHYRVQLQPSPRPGPSHG